MAKIRRILQFIPGNNPGMLNNAAIVDADTVMLDLEDAVALEDKEDARFLVRQALMSIRVPGKDYAVRINGIATEYWEKDLEMIVPCQPSFIQLPKAEHPSDIETVVDRIEEIEKKHGIPVGTVKVCPIIETAVGIENAYQVASTRTESLCGLALGAEDLVADLGGIRSEDSMEVLFARSRLVNAARAVGISPSDTAFTHVDDDELLVKDCTLSRKLGFDGRAILSPRQCKLAMQCYMPSEKEIAYAHAVIEAIEEGKKKGKGAVTLGGKMIDEPIAKRARALLESLAEE